MAVSHSEKLEPGGIFSSHAASYAEIGWPVFPLTPGSKIPLKGSRGVKDATCDLDVIAGWARDFPDANVGIAMGGSQRLIAIDSDPRHGGDRTLFDLACQGLRLPRCPEQVTANRGRHKVYKLPEGLEIAIHKLGDGVDIKYASGYIVGGGSVVGPTDAGPGGKYLWLLSPWHQEPPPLPGWCIRRLQPPRQNVVVPFARSHSPDAATRRLEGMANRVANAAKGDRNNTLNWAAFNAGELVREGHIPMGMVEQMLTSAGLQCGLDIAEIKSTITSALRAALQKRRTL